MFKQLRSYIPKLSSPSLELSEVAPAKKNQIICIAGDSIQTLPINRISVQSAVRVPDVEFGEPCEMLQDQGGSTTTSGQLDEHICVQCSDDNQNQNDQNLEQQEMECQDEQSVQANCENGQNEADDTWDKGKPENELPCFPVYLQTHFEVMYYLGLSPIKGNGMPGSKVQMVAFVIITLVSLFHFLGLLKHFILIGSDFGHLTNNIIVCYSIGSVLLQLHLLKLFAFDFKCITDILQMPNDDKHQLFQQPKQRFSTGVIIGAGVILLVSVVAAIRVDWIVDGDSLEDIALYGSIDVGRNAFLWAKDKNKTAVLDEQFGSTLSSTTLMMGLFGVTMNFFGTLKEYLVRDILLMSSLHTYRLSQCFKGAVIRHLQEENPSDENIRTLKKLHQMTLQMANVVDNGFRHFFKWVHIENWLACSYFLFELFRGKFTNVYVLAGFICVPKILLTYIISAEATIMNHATRHLIEEKYAQSESDEFDKPRFMMIMKVLEDHPIGIGRGQFQLDESFAFRFVGVVISCFLLFADTEEATSCDCKLERNIIELSSSPTHDLV